MIKDFTSAQVGKFGEDYCAKYLRWHGFRIYKRNAKIGHLETDIIAYNRKLLVFVEVKTRRKDKHNYDTPAAAITYKKRTNLLNFAYAFISNLPEKFKNKDIRLDVCEIWLTGDKKLKVCDLNYIEGAITGS